MVDRFERPVHGLTPVVRHGPRGDPPRAAVVLGAQGVRDGQSHIGWGDLGDRRGIGELDHRMDLALRVDDDLDAVEVDAEEQMGLDDLEPLVDEGGRVDRDHRPIDTSDA